MKAPFPWFGGKRRIASDVWAALGDVDNYVEPFAGSLAILLERPAWHRGTTETVNDADRYLANFWRAITVAPEDVASWADWPVNEADLTARHIWLVSSGAERIAKIEGDPDFFDAKVAGWWVWGQCQWIGSGWCSGNGPWAAENGLLISRNPGQGVNRQLPHLGDAGRGVNRQLPHLGDAGQGACNSADMEAGGAGAPRATWDRSLWREGEEPLVYGYFRALRKRLRCVRVCCGDWSRIVTDGALAHGASVGILLDPPYSGDVRTPGLYNADDYSVSEAVRTWALEHGEDRRLRIALCGYEGEHDMPASWRVIHWQGGGAYLGSGCEGEGRANRKRERIWLSPGCLGTGQQLSLLGGR